MTSTSSSSCPHRLAAAAAAALQPQRRRCAASVVPPPSPISVHSSRLERRASARARAACAVGGELRALPRRGRRRRRRRRRRCRRRRAVAAAAAAAAAATADVAPPLPPAAGSFGSAFFPNFSRKARSASAIRACLPSNSRARAHAEPRAAAQLEELLVAQSAQHAAAAAAARLPRRRRRRPCASCPSSSATATASAGTAGCALGASRSRRRGPRPSRRCTARMCDVMPCSFLPRPWPSFQPNLASMRRPKSIDASAAPALKVPPSDDTVLRERRPWLTAMARLDTQPTVGGCKRAPLRARALRFDRWRAGKGSQPATRRLQPL